ncbi:hypothetical protein GOV13_02680 [Candidatus Pacearchaeota archaeon]|nr:hypothetical protein [Candidatus Pacearchaeota archaeon]
MDYKKWNRRLEPIAFILAYLLIALGLWFDVWLSAFVGLYGVVHLWHSDNGEEK